MGGAREDLERKLYHKRATVQVRFIELADTIPVHGPKTDVIDQIMFGDFLAHENNSLVEVVENGPEHGLCSFGRLGLDDQTRHGGGVAIHVFGLVEIQAAGQVFDVDHVRNVAVREPQDGECASYGGVASPSEGDNLQAHVVALRGVQ